MWTGLLFALAAGLMWGLVFVAPLLLPDYPAALLTAGRYLAFGLIAVPLALLDRRELGRLTRADWWSACRLSAIGNFLYYLTLSAAIQRAGGPLPTMLIGTLPVVIALCSNQRNAARDGHYRWRQLTPALMLIAAGIACVNQVERAGVAAADMARYVQGAVLALVAVACWTWYPIRNADWLRTHTGRSPRAWATAQGLVTLPMAVLAFMAIGALQMTGVPVLPADFATPAGPRPGAYVGLMLAVGLFASWLGTLCWNEASQRLPTTLVGQLIVFETLSALVYAQVLRGEWPRTLSVVGVLLLVGGVCWALRLKPVPRLESADGPSRQ
ncbi:Permease of the drug/metabolite transporter (DMT) superfamily [Roseateles sp. YR242]|uniref:DMT family transporter n=1 Tax=Roseateles sp. YR242 TaxID=1855305 RepID=UPI0008B2CF7A|nr:DMT family transporter [Roseateles sp. YR242]SEK79636.1 Permease of the drug/metabolite transporter (DMT) superfamily [Roseateles sp. YR242]